MGMIAPDEDSEISVVEYVKSRLDTQDHVMAGISEDVKATRKQATKTNGRVTMLETQAAIEKALQEKAAKDSENEVNARRWLINIVASAAFVVSGAALGSIIHLIHL